jgi:hypothetical protein
MFNIIPVEFMLFITLTLNGKVDWNDLIVNVLDVEIDRISGLLFRRDSLHTHYFQKLGINRR